jgi:very-short-patch-repair endonuclease
MTSAERTPSGNERQVRRLADAQHGVVSRRQARGTGISDAAIARRVSAELWERVLPGVFRITGGPITRSQLPMAAALWAGDGSVVSHATAAGLWRIEGVRERRVELWVPVPRNPRHELVAVHRGSRIDRADRTMLDSVPVTTPVRTLIDVSARMEDAALLAAMESLFLRGLANPARLEMRLRALRSSGRRGAGRVERLLEERDGAPLESRLEAKVWLALRRSNIRVPVRQYWITAPGGRYRLDFAWPDCKVALECDGWAHHGTRAAFGKDRARLSDLVSLGWRVLVVTWDVATKSPERLVRWVDSALTQAAA